MADERTGESTSLWAGLAVGLGVVAVFGIAGVVLFLILRRGQTQIVQAPSQPLSGSFGGLPAFPFFQPQLQPMTAMMSPPTASPGLVDFRPLTTANTRTLPSLSAARSQAIRIAGSNNAPVRATLRAVGPPGSFAALSFDAGELNIPGTAAVLPTGFTYSIPSGGSQVVDLNRGQYLYAKGNTNDVRLSVLAALVPDGTSR
jgi:hypothetical protein